MSISVRKIMPNFVGEIGGVDMRRLDAAAFAAVRKAWLENQVIVFHGQQLEEDDLVGFSRR
ncbi:MAG: TauD/TfdA family dioxygenase, partial [Alphaproteobacteria bacterium]|nr:TauD/TfdA family dioxygenase [Alphaproteobacteria bacterium]